MIAVFNFFFGSIWILILLLVASGYIVTIYFKQKKGFVIWNLQVQAEALKAAYQPKNNQDLEEVEPPKNWDSSMTDR